MLLSNTQNPSESEFSHHFPVPFTLTPLRTPCPFFSADTGEVGDTVIIPRYGGTEARHGRHIESAMPCEEGLLAELQTLGPWTLKTHWLVEETRLDMGPGRQGLC